MKSRRIDVAVCLSLFAVALAIGLVRAALKPRPHTPEEFGLAYEVGAVDMNGNGLDDYTDLLLGARRDAENRPIYNGRYWESAYPPPFIGVCTDVGWRAFREAGYNLRAMVDYDVRLRPEAYPGITEPDDKIDFRRVRNLKVFFDEYGRRLTTDPLDIAAWQAGDIVIFGELDGTPTHFGIISDKRNADGVAYVIHNAGQPDRDEDVLNTMHVVGHYRFDASVIDGELLIPWQE